MPVALDEPILVVAPHADDETLGCGGLICAKRAAGVKVAIVIVTDGQFGGGGERSIAGRAALAGQRRSEAVAAAEILGVDARDVHFLGLQDGSVNRLRASEMSATCDTLARLIGRYRAKTVLVTSQIDQHPDHAGASILVHRVISEGHRDVSILEYPVWLPWLSPFEAVSASRRQKVIRLDVTTFVQRKRRAFSAYQTQIAHLPAGFTDRFFGRFEVFFAPRRSHLAWFDAAPLGR